jgi:hypothetical protein
MEPRHVFLKKTAKVKFSYGKRAILFFPFKSFTNGLRNVLDFAGSDHRIFLIHVHRSFGSEHNKDNRCMPPLT